MNIPWNRSSLSFICSILALQLTASFDSAQAVDDKWKSEMIADASKAAPPSVTDTATIYAWTPKGEMKLVRQGKGPYKCVASGAFSLRLGKPPLPYPDPMCMDQNGWAFFKALWSEKNPLKPSKPYPTGPGLVWMLAGMSIKKGAVAMGAGDKSVIQTHAGKAAGDVFQMSPHVMIMPMPFNKKAAKLSKKYNIGRPLDSWIMAAGTPIEHLMVHFSKEDAKALMEPNN